MAPRKPTTLSSIVSNNPILSSVIVLVLGFFGSQIYNTQLINAQSNTKIELIGNDIKQINESFKKLETQIGDLVNDTKQDTKMINEQISNIKERLSKIETTLNSSSSRINELEQKK